MLKGNGKVFNLDYNEKPKYYKGKIFRNLKGMTLKGKIEFWWDDLKRAWHRMKNGYDHSMVWGFCDVWPEQMVHILEDLINNHMGYPGTEEIPTSEKWEEILREMQWHFKESVEDLCSQKNEWEDTFTIDLVDDEPNEDGCRTCHTKVDNEENWEKYKVRDTELYYYRKEHLEKALDMLKENFHDMWD